MATTILDLDAFPDSFSAGNWPLSAFNNGTFRFTFTPTAASSDSSWGGNNFYALFAAADNGGLWIVDESGTRNIGLYKASDGATIVKRALTWAADANIVITVNNTAETITISGAATGDGTFAFTDSGDGYSNVTLGCGVYGGGGYTWTGALSDVDDGVTGFTLTAESGAFAVTGTAAGVEYGREIAAAPGSFTETGTAASIEYGREVAADAGSFVETGTAASLERGYRIVAESGSFTHTGAAADIIYDALDNYTIAADSGTFAESGTDAALKVHRELEAEVGAFVETGGAAGVERGYPVVAASGVFAETGTDAGLRRTHRIVAASGTFGVTGADASLVASGAVEIGVHASAAFLYGGGAHATTLTTGGVTTQTSGSSFLIFVACHTGLAAPTDSEGNTYTQVGTSHAYADYPDYETKVFVCVSGTGGSGHTVSQAGIGTTDEATISFLEVIGATRVVGFDHSEETAAATITSPPVTLTGAGVVVAPWWGNGGDINGTMDATPEAGFDLLEEYYVMGSNGAIQHALAAKAVDVAGTYDCDWVGTMGVANDPQGAQLWIVGLQGIERLDAGSFSVAGTAASVERGYRIAAEGGSFVVAGTAASIERGYTVAAESGSIAEAGTAASVEVAHVVGAGSGAFAEAGADASLEHGRRLGADSGSFAESGTAASVEYGREVAADGGAIEETGTAADVKATRVLSAAGGSFAESGADATLRRGRILAAEAATLAATGTAAGVEYGREIGAAGGTFAVAGTDADVEYGTSAAPLPVILAVALVDTAWTVTIVAATTRWAVTLVDAAWTVTIA